LIIRPAAEADVPALCRLMQCIQDLHAAAHPDVFRPTLDAAAAADFFTDLLANERNLVLVAETAGETIAYIWCEERQSAGSFYGAGAHTGYIHHISVAPGQRRAGAGRRLVSETLAQMKERGATRVGVDFWTFNDRARALFTGLGFAVQQEVASRKL
jgi:ribosomal protein S18 acetylase RimI-like enzyme